MAEFRASIEIAAPPETVFAYLTTNAGMTAWMGQYADLDPTPGGRFAVDIAGHPVRGEYLLVDPPHRVVVSWGFAGSADLPAGASTVEFRLTAVAGGTRVDLRHSNLPDTELPGHADGWRHFLSRLASAGAGTPAGPDEWLPFPDRPHPVASATRPKENPMTDAFEIVRKYHDAWTHGRVDEAMDCVADDIVCRAPGADLTGKDEYRRFIAGFAPQLTGIGDIAEFADGDRVALFYYPQTASTSTTPAAECFTVRGGKIVENVLIFDRLSYGPPPQR